MEHPVESKRPNSPQVILKSQILAYQKVGLQRLLRMPAFPGLILKAAD